MTSRESAQSPEKQKKLPWQDAADAIEEELRHLVESENPAEGGLSRAEIDLYGCFALFNAVFTYRADLGAIGAYLYRKGRGELQLVAEPLEVWQNFQSVRGECFSLDPLTNQSKEFALRILVPGIDRTTVPLHSNYWRRVNTERLAHNTGIGWCGG